MSHLEAWILKAAAVCFLVHIRSLVDNIAGIACFCSFLIMYFCVHLDAFQSLEGVNDAQIQPIAVFLIKLKESVSQKEVGDESSQGIGPSKTCLKGGQRAVCASERKTGLSSWPAWLRISTRRTESS